MTPRGYLGGTVDGGIDDADRYDDEEGDITDLSINEADWGPYERQPCPGIEDDPGMTDGRMKVKPNKGERHDG